MKLYSWNVNGLRAIQKKGFIPWMQQTKPEILCLQETKAHPEQLDPELLELEGYYSYFSKPEKKGYSGVALYTQTQPISIDYSFGYPDYDTEGRVIIARYPDFIVCNVYFPNGKRSEKRLNYKMNFYRDFLAYVQELVKQGNSVVICGDVNTAHTELDLARPKQNEKISGFLPKERAWIDEVIEAGFLDTYRLFHPEKECYSWWSYRGGARERNVGWRIDYVFINEAFQSQVTNANIHTNVMGSDHCPISINLTSSLS